MIVPTPVILEGMQRDMDRIRAILFKMEEHTDGFAPREFNFDGDWTQDQFNYHVWLLGDAGLMRVTVVTSLGSSGPAAIPISLTWEGHEFGAAARSDTNWSHAKEKAKSVGSSLTFAVLKQLLESLMKHQLGI